MKLPTRYKPTGQTFGGGQGVVSVWEDSSLAREVAVKTLSTRGIGGSLEEEASLLAAIKSKHVVELYEMGRDSVSGKHYLIMEYVGGAALTGYTPANTRSLYLTLYQIICGIVDIHSAGCMHRDLKPDNLKRDVNDVIKIIDFGIGARQTEMMTSRGRGTDGYRGPEFYSSPMKVTPASDVYAFGVIAYEFSFSSLSAELLQEPPKVPPTFANALIGSANARIAPGVVDILDRCFQSDPNHRPTAEEIQEVLARHLVRTRHVANFVHGGKMYTMSKTAPQYSVTAPKGSFSITYDGLVFSLSNITGDVYINGNKVFGPTILPNSCVIIIGGGTGFDRAFIPFNVSHPEVVL